MQISFSLTTLIGISHFAMLDWTNEPLCDELFILEEV